MEDDREVVRDVEAQVVRMKAGDDFSASLTWPTAATAVDLTAYTVTSKLRKRDGTLVDTLTCTPDADQVANPGVVVISATAAETALWPALTLEYDVRFVDGDGVVATSRTYQVIVELARSR